MDTDSAHVIPGFANWGFNKNCEVFSSSAAEKCEESQ